MVNQWLTALKSIRHILDEPIPVDVVVTEKVASFSRDPLIIPGRFICSVTTG